MNLNRLGMGLGDIVEVPGTRLAGLPFAMHGHTGLQAGNVSLGPTGGNLGSFALSNNVFPDGIALFSSAGGMQLSQLHSLPALQQQDAGKLAGLADLGGSPGGQRGASLARPARSNDGNSGKSSSAYASRHQAAEQRRRTRINERLDLLRKMVPHSDRANTASFLEEVLKYIDSLKTRVTELESTLAALKSNGKAPAAAAGSGVLGGAVAGSPAVGQSGALLRTEADFRAAAGLGASGTNAASSSGQAGQQSVSLALQQLQQQQLQQLLQQQHDAALAALQEEQQQQAALLAAQQLRQQQELAAARQANLADLATQLGLRTLPNIAGSQGGTPQPQISTKIEAGMGSVGSMLSKHGKDQRGGGSTSLLPSTSIELRGSSQMTHSAANTPAMLHILPVQQLQLHNAGGELAGLPAVDGINGASAAAINTAAEAGKTSEGSSPVSSEESGVPLKKRKVLML